MSSPIGHSKHAKMTPLTPSLQSLAVTDCCDTHPLKTAPAKWPPALMKMIQSWGRERERREEVREAWETGPWGRGIDK